MESSSRRVSLRDGAAATRGLTNGSRGAHQPSLNIMLAHRRVDASVSPDFSPLCGKPRSWRVSNGARRQPLRGGVHN